MVYVTRTFYDEINTKVRAQYPEDFEYNKVSINEHLCNWFKIALDIVERHDKDGLTETTKHCVQIIREDIKLFYQNEMSEDYKQMVDERLANIERNTEKNV